MHILSGMLWKVEPAAGKVSATGSTAAGGYDMSTDHILQLLYEQQNSATHR